MKWRWAAALCLGLGCILFFATRKPILKVVPLNGVWYWHSPFQLKVEEKKQLAELGVDTLFVRAGTFTTDGNRVRLRFPQRWLGSPGKFKIVAVYNFDGGLVSHLGEIPTKQLAEDVRREIQNSIKTIPFHVDGIQMDVDSPTRKLPIYASLLSQIRTGLSRQQSFSATGLPTWLSSRDYALVAAETDFMAPQFYEGSTAQNLREIGPIASSPRALEKGIERLERFGRPYVLGLAAYGRAMLYDTHGKLIGPYPDLSADDALRHPSFEFVESRLLQNGENLLVLEAKHPDTAGRGKGFRMAYTLPSPEQVRFQVQVVRKMRPALCRGWVWYRFAELGESTALPLVSLVHAVHNTSTSPHLDVRLRRKSMPYDFIAGRTKNPKLGNNLELEVQNKGDESSLAAPDALTIEVVFDRPGIGAVQPGGFDAAEVGQGTGDQFVPCGRARANVVRLRHYHLLPGQKIRFSSIETESGGPTSAELFWRIRSVSNSRSIDGNLAIQSLSHTP